MLTVVFNPILVESELAAAIIIKKKEWQIYLILNGKNTMFLKCMCCPKSMLKMSYLFWSEIGIVRKLQVFSKLLVQYGTVCSAFI